jgi:hypothetical protein
MPSLMYKKPTPKAYMVIETTRDGSIRRVVSCHRSSTKATARRKLCENMYKSYDYTILIRRLFQ